MLMPIDLDRVIPLPPERSTKVDPGAVFSIPGDLPWGPLQGPPQVWYTPPDRVGSPGRFPWEGHRIHLVCATEGDLQMAREDQLVDAPAEAQKWAPLLAQIMYDQTTVVWEYLRVDLVEDPRETLLVWVEGGYYPILLPSEIGERMSPSGDRHQMIAPFLLSQLAPWMRPDVPDPATLPWDSTEGIVRSLSRYMTSAPLWSVFRKGRQRPWYPVLLQGMAGDHLVNRQIVLGDLLSILVLFETKRSDPKRSSATEEDLWALPVLTPEVLCTILALPSLMEDLGGQAGEPTEAKTDLRLFIPQDGGSHVQDYTLPEGSLQRFRRHRLLTAEAAALVYSVLTPEDPFSRDCPKDTLGVSYRVARLYPELMYVHRQTLHEALQGMTPQQRPAPEGRSLGDAVDHQVVENLVAKK